MGQEQLEKRQKTIEKFLDDSYARLYSHALCHYEAANRYASYRLKLGIPSIVLSAIMTAAVGVDAPTLMDVTTAMESGASTLSIVIRVVMVAIALSSGVLGSLMTFLDFEGLRRQHHETGIRYSGLLRKIENFEVRDALGLDEASVKEQLDEISSTEAVISEQAPSIPAKTYHFYFQQTKDKQKGRKLPDPRDRFHRL